MMAALLSLSGCGGAVQTTFPPTCPHTVILSDAADVTRFRRTASGTPGRDLTDMVLDGKIVTISGSCSRGDNDALKAELTIGIDLTRGPAARGRNDVVPIFVAVTQGQTILDRRVFQIPVGFPPNIDTLRLGSDALTLALPAGAAKQGSSYDVFVGFLLTPMELAENRKRGPR